MNVRTSMVLLWAIFIANSYTANMSSTTQDTATSRNEMYLFLTENSSFEETNNFDPSLNEKLTTDTKLISCESPKTVVFYCVTSCVETCEDLSPQMPCAKPCRPFDTCVCPRDEVENKDGQCVAVSTCIKDEDNFVQDSSGGDASRKEPGLMALVWVGMAVFVFITLVIPGAVVLCAGTRRTREIGPHSVRPLDRQHSATSRSISVSSAFRQQDLTPVYTTNAWGQTAINILHSKA